MSTYLSKFRCMYTLNPHQDTSIFGQIFDILFGTEGVSHFSNNFFTYMYVVYLIVMCTNTLGLSQEFTIFVHFQAACRHGKM
jgi:hypothetical protein